MNIDDVNMMEAEPRSMISDLLQQISGGNLQGIVKSGKLQEELMLDQKLSDMISGKLNQPASDTVANLEELLATPSDVSPNSDVAYDDDYNETIVTPTEKLVFVDQQTKEVVGQSGHRNVKLVSRDISLSENNTENIVTSKSTLNITLPKISSSRSLGNSMYAANVIEISSVQPNVSHVVRATGGDVFVNGKDNRRIQGSQTKRFYGINGIWYETIV